MTKPYFTILASCIFFLSTAHELRADAPDYNLAVKKFCEANPYDCKDGGAITGHMYNTFLRGFYAEIEAYMAEEGFDAAEFEACNAALNCLTEGVDVKNSAYKITRTFPRTRDFFYAFGGVNQSSGVHFVKTLSDEDAQGLCSNVVRSGNKLKSSARKAISSEAATIVEIKDRFYKTHEMLYAVKLKKISHVHDIYNNQEASCWLRRNKEVFVFETKGEKL